MSRVLLIVFALLFIVGCGGESGSNEGAAGSGGSGTPSRLASLGIDPLGRGDGIDITESDYTGRCYEDDELEANRPMLPDPRQVAADEAEATARASQAAADAARVALADAKDAFERSFVPEVAPMPDRSLAGIFYLSALEAAKDGTEAAYQVGLELLTPEKTTTWKDILENPNLIFKSLGESFVDNLGFTFDDTGLGEVVTDLVTAAVKQELLEFLLAARTLALDEYTAASNQLIGGMAASADPALSEAFDAAQDAYDAALEQSIEDSNALLEAWLAIDAPSEFPPCDSEELRQSLADAFCTGAFVNPITPEEEAEIPGITARLDAYVARVCAAVG
jgi:hypothetical protein